MHGDGLAMLLLESVAAGLVQTVDEADLLLRSTLWWEDQVRMLRHEPHLSVDQFHLVVELVSNAQVQLQVDLSSRTRQLLDVLSSRSPPLLMLRTRGGRPAEGDAKLQVTARGRAVASAQGIIQCGASGVDALAQELSSSLQGGVYLLCDVHLIYVCISDELLRDKMAVDGGPLCPKGWPETFARLAWPGERAAGETHLSRVVALVAPTINSMFCQAFE